MRHRFKAVDSWRLCAKCEHPEVGEKNNHHNLPEGWDVIDTAPKNATEIEVMLSSGETLVAHWAQNLSGEDQPPFIGWFRRVLNAEGKTSGFTEIQTPIAWRALA